MKFRTEFAITPLQVPISCRDTLLSIGSCFSEEIAHRLRRVGFQLHSNPTGVLFNPISIAKLIEDLSQEQIPEISSLQQAEGLWFHELFHSSFSHPNPQQAIETMQHALIEGSKKLRQADRVLITFGSAYVYERQGEVVANCHKQPASQFQRRLLSIEEIVERWSRLLQEALQGKKILFTLSPVRHLRDKAEENSLSKAILRVAIATLCQRFASAEYFPAYELLMDDLRDYRFYAADLTHPSPEAVEYIWERFSEAAFDAETKEFITQSEAICKRLAHRPLHPESPNARQFQLATEEAARRLEVRSGLSILKNNLTQ